MASAPPEEAVRAIGNYDVVRKLADGSMSSVYEGRDRKTGARVAIKIAWGLSADNPVLLKRFEQEYRVGSQLRHPNLIRALAFGQVGVAPYLVLEYVDGPDLWQRIERDGRLPEAEAVAIICQVAQGLHQAHKHGVIHRDIKPDNILLAVNGKARLADLGLAKDLEEDLDLTQPHRGLGTPHFIAPEQFSDAKHAGPRCDIYALAATLYMAVTGQMPFEARTLAGILKKKLSNDLTPPRQLVPELSERLDWVIRRALQAAPEQRHASCPEFAAALAGEDEGRRPAAGTPAEGAALLAGSARSGGQERRRKARYRCQLEVFCDVLTSVHPDDAEARDRWPATVLDLSATGIGLLLPRRFEPQTVLAIELQSADRRVTRKQEVLVLRVQRAGGGQWFLGGTFVQQLTREELGELL